MNRLNKYITMLFVLSLVFLALHAAYDGIFMEEAEDWGVSLAEYFLYLALVYLIVPPFGLYLARRLNPFGWGIVGLYAFQVMYGAGITDDRPMIGIMPRLLGAFGIHIASLRGYGFFSIILEILGFGEPEPRDPSLFGTAIAYSNIAINAVLILLCVLALRMWWKERRANKNLPASGQPSVETRKIV